MPNAKYLVIGDNSDTSNNFVLRIKPDGSDETELSPNIALRSVFSANRLYYYTKEGGRQQTLRIHNIKTGVSFPEIKCIS